MTITVNVIDKNSKKPLDNAIVFAAIYDTAGNLVYKGFLKETTHGKYVLNISGESTKNWGPGSYTIKVLAYSEEAFWPSIMTTTFIVLG